MSPAYEIITAGLLRFVRKPVEIIPDTDGLCFIEDLSSGRRTHHGVGKFVDGEWQDAHGQALKWSPTHWTVTESRNEEGQACIAARQDDGTSITEPISCDGKGQEIGRTSCRERGCNAGESCEV